MKLDMNMKYRDWIDRYISDRNGDVRYQCGTATELMLKAFPELRRAVGYLVDARQGLTDADFKSESGHANYPVGGPAHVWCVASDNTIVDPTGVQFGIPTEHLQYFEHDDAKHGILPKGKCPNCGCFRYGTNVCDDLECAEDFSRYLDRELVTMRAERIIP